MLRGWFLKAALCFLLAAMVMGLGGCTLLLAGDLIQARQTQKAQTSQPSADNSAQDRDIDDEFPD